MKNVIPTIAITTGEPAGIGPDICLKLVSEQQQRARLVYIGCPELLSQRAYKLGISVKFKLFNTHEYNISTPGLMEVLPENTDVAVELGQPDERNADYVIRTLQRALDGCKTGIFDAMTTAPVHKGVINQAGIPFTGHTEWLAEASNTAHVVMMLTCNELRVALATTHLPLSKVSESITQPLLQKTFNIIHAELRKKFHIQDPKIFVCGLNPHAGENGYLGSEELETIIPVIDDCRSKGMSITGPLPADTLFSPVNIRESDVVLAMYHDQGLPVLKYKGFGEAVNVTLGLPFIRTSVDHGTALDLAGTGLAHASSLQHAVNCAVDMVNI